jgi:hypothetical protein
MSQLDITGATFAKYKPEVDVEQVRYDKSNIYSQIVYSESNAVSPDFLSVHLNYDVIKTSPKTKTVSPPQLTTDIESALSENFGKSGFILVITSVINGDNVVQLGQSEIDNTIYYQNEYLSWAWLMARYWNWQCEADTGVTSLGETITAEDVKDFLIQENIKFYYNGTINWHCPVMLQLGKAWIKKIEHHLESGFYAIDVGFDVYQMNESVTADSTTVTADSTLITADTI